MEVAVTFRHMEPTESLRAYAVEKVSKVQKYLDFPTEAHIVLSVEKFRHTADVTLSLDGTTIKGAEETGDMYSAIDQVMDKIEIQVKRNRAKIRKRRPEARRSEEGPAGADTAEEVDLSPDELVIETETMDAKPMDPEEAAMQLHLSPQGFLVFRNSRSNEINVLYKRKDGNLGLIQPSI